MKESFHCKQRLPGRQQYLVKMDLQFLEDGVSILKHLRRTLQKQQAIQNHIVIKMNIMIRDHTWYFNHTGMMRFK